MYALHWLQSSCQKWKKFTDRKRKYKREKLQKLKYSDTTRSAFAHARRVSRAWKWRPINTMFISLRGDISVHATLKDSLHYLYFEFSTELVLLLLKVEHDVCQNCGFICSSWWSGRFRCCWRLAQNRNKPLFASFSEQIFKIAVS